MKINCIIVEDEPLALDRMTGYVLKLPYLNLLSTFVFLDINMGEFSGIQLLETLNVKPEIIITTAYTEYALKGFDLHVTDYLLKPFTFERFVLAVDRVQANLSKVETMPDKNFIFIKTEYRLEKLLLNEILYIEGMRDYRSIFTTNKRIMTLKPFKEFVLDIPSNLICRVHKSFMVALDKIDSVERDRIRIKDVIIPISETYKKSFFELINQPVK